MFVSGRTDGASTTCILLRSRSPANQKNRGIFIASYLRSRAIRPSGHYRTVAAPWLNDAAGRGENAELISYRKYPGCKAAAQLFGAGLRYSGGDDRHLGTAARRDIDRK